jgi:hypothetical protein
MDTIIEILSYAPKNMADFIKFCVEGDNDAAGHAKVAKKGGGLKTGVFDWLIGLVPIVQEVHFFTTDDSSDVSLFVAVVKGPAGNPAPGEATPPWMKGIPGFEEFVLPWLPLPPDGQFGTLPSFPSVPQLQAALLPLNPRPDLDEGFIQRQSKINSIPFDRLPGGEMGVRAALRGDKGTDLKLVLDEVASLK